MIKACSNFTSMLRVWVCFGLIIFSQAASAEEDSHDHSGHSDALLEILHAKIKVTKLQNNFAQLNSDKQFQNLKQQASHLSKATRLLQVYTAIPEGRYPNIAMYHDSLISRAGLIKEFAHILMIFQQQSQTLLFIEK